MERPRCPRPPIAARHHDPIASAYEVGLLSTYAFIIAQRIPDRKRHPSLAIGPPDGGLRNVHAESVLENIAVPTAVGIVSFIDQSHIGGQALGELGSEADLHGATIGALAGQSRGHSFFVRHSLPPSCTYTATVAPVSPSVNEKPPIPNPESHPFRKRRSWRSVFSPVSKDHLDGWNQDGELSYDG